MGEYQEVAERILGVLEEMEREGLEEIDDEEKIRIGDIPEIIGSPVGMGGPINFYPGEPDFRCCHFSLFLSLESPAYKQKIKAKKHLTCRKAVEKIVQHMQGACSKNTRVAVWVTDSWNRAAVNEWRANLEQIKNYAHLEIYLLSGRAVSEIFI